MYMYHEVRPQTALERWPRDLDNEVSTGSLEDQAALAEADLAVTYCLAIERNAGYCLSGLDRRLGLAGMSVPVPCKPLLVTFG